MQYFPANIYSIIPDDNLYFVILHILLRDVFHIGLVIGPRPAVVAWGAAERQYSRPRTYN
jgi:hypothetical protein